MKFKSAGIIIALILIMFMSAIETSIISLALPTIKDDLNVKSSVSLVFAVYFIAIVIANPIVGELLSRVKIIYLTITGLILFTLGSLFSGLSDTFTILIISRFIQGLGSGILMALSQIVPKLAFPIPFRYKVMGMVGSVWGVASLLGPLMGGAILEIASWHWLFFINLPIAVIAGALVLWTFHFEDEVLVKNRLDYKGLALFYVMIAALMVTVLSTAHLVYNSIGFIVFLLAALLLFKAEKKQRVPFIPVTEFKRTIIIVFLTDFLYAIMLMGYNLYMPIYLQEEVGLSPLQSGLTIFPISLAWITINFNMHRIEAGRTKKMLYLSAFTSLMLCSILLLFGSSVPLFTAVSLLLAGASFGIVYTKDSITVQEESSPEQMKRMMSLYTLTKSLGNSIGSTIMGYIYVLPVVLIGPNIHNVMLAVIIILLVLMGLWTTCYKEQSRQ
ncbi:multidrug efflux MFS transporter SdrM [Macrococcus equipercicus]|uniref:MFS transporter n=1 Tax=Macrococcus equipercicus TaxID=69967 RepID=A0A9Q9BS05_9STAP|nr:multidrug efflux MFS transporter SdrM [Macrococcus equipercicus]UTH14614.1 MFS transporter [Macrococcus equipercicus]